MGSNTSTGDRAALRFEVSLAMIQEGVEILRSFDPFKEDWESAVAQILYTARDIHEGRFMG